MSNNHWASSLEDKRKMKKEYESLTFTLRKYLSELRDKVKNIRKKYFKTKQERLEIVVNNINKDDYLYELFNAYNRVDTYYDSIFLYPSYSRIPRQTNFYATVQFLNILQRLVLTITIRSMDDVEVEKSWYVTEETVADILKEEIKLIIPALQEIPRN